MADTVEVEEQEGLCMDNFQWDDDVRYRFECTTGGSNKFYEIVVSEQANGHYCVTTRYGSMKPGAHVSELQFMHASKFEAEAQASHTTQLRLSHGYKEV